MNLKKLIISFLAPRDPAAYPAKTIAMRLNAKKMLDHEITEDEVTIALRDLHRLEMVSMTVNRIDDGCVWQIAREGVKEWTMQGRMTVV